MTSEQLAELVREESGPKWDHDGTKASEREVLELLYGLVRCRKPELCIETGTFAGHGTNAIASALVANNYGQLTTIEADPDLAQQLREAGMPDRTTLIEGDSLQYVMELETPVQFGFVDCGDWMHRVEVAAKLYRKLDSEGILAVHDTVYYPDFLPELRHRLGAPQLELKTKHGLAIWQEW